jgi:putative phosphoesterase
MRIGVLSDTHDHRANVGRIVELFNGAGVERVIHTGDITTPRTLELLARLDVPLYGVYGNNDVDRESLHEVSTRLGLHFLDPPRALEWAGRRVLVTHDPDLLAQADLADVEVLLHGHHHRYVSEEVSGVLRFNPGECAGHVQGRNSIALIDLISLETERIRF